MNTVEEQLNHIQTLKNKRDAVTEMYDAEIQSLSAKLEAQLKAEDKGCLKTDMATAYWQNSTSVEVEDWDVVMQFVNRYMAFDILQRRISPAQLQARIDAGAEIEGVTIKKSKTFIIKGAK